MITTLSKQKSALLHKEIPVQLKVLTSTYDPTGDTSCSSIASLVIELEAVLDTDDNDVVANKKMSSKVKKTSLKEISRAAGGLIPKRGIVCKTTGASRHEKRTIVAYKRGMARRAYLKVIGVQKGYKPQMTPAAVQ